MSLQAAKTCKHILDCSGKGDRYGEDDPEDFARHIAKCIAITKSRIAGGNADEAARLAFIAGAWWAKANMKWAWETDALRGEKAVKDAAAGGHAKSANQRRETERILAEMGKLIDKGASISGAARRCAGNRIGASAGANQKLWGRHRSEKARTVQATVQKQYEK